MQHAGLTGNNVEAEEIKYIIQKEKVLILLDGYDDYTPGTNQDIDKAIRKEALRNCCIVITSRETKDLLAIREYMDPKVEITGFDEKKIEDYATKYLGGKDKSEELMQIARKRKIITTKFFDDEDYGILRIPLFLHMVCVLKNTSLPKTRTGILSEIVKKCSDWEQIRKNGQRKSKSLDVEALAVKMGEFLLKRLVREEKCDVFTEVRQHFGVRIKKYVERHRIYIFKRQPQRGSK